MSAHAPIADTDDATYDARMKRALFPLITVLAACDQGSQADATMKNENCSSVPTLMVQNAERDANSAYKRHDQRLMGVYGYVIEVPGVQEPTIPVHMIEGTSDSECYEANLRIRRYANAYNRELMRLIAEP